MINYTDRLDKALRVASLAHEKQNQHRKGSGIPYIIHPVGVMIIASGATDDEDTLIACLLHDVLEDVDQSIYSQDDMLNDFGENVINIVKDVTKNDEIKDWHERSKAYKDHIEFKASNEAVIVCTADKIHNLKSMLIDYKKVGDKLWEIFATNNSQDQLWWYESILEVLKKRKAPEKLITELDELLSELKIIIN